MDAVWPTMIGVTGTNTRGRNMGEWQRPALSRTIVLLIFCNELLVKFQMLHELLLALRGHSGFIYTEEEQHKLTVNSSLTFLHPCEVSSGDGEEDG